MAINTEDRRRSVTGFYGYITIKPVADGTIGAADRAQAAGFYSGLTYGAPPSVVVTPYYYEVLMQGGLI